MARITALPAIMAICLLVVGCAPTYKAPPRHEQVAKTASTGKVKVDAYLFNARLRRDGKPTSFRLELLQTDSAVVLGGRGYLGRGALKGRMTADSLEIYFPATNEYLYESVADMVVSSFCPGRMQGLNLMRLLRRLPQASDFNVDATLERDDSDRKRPRFSLSWPDCPWRLQLAYNRQKTSWRLREIRFDDGDRTSFTAKRRSFKEQIAVTRKRLKPAVPVDAVRVSP